MPSCTKLLRTLGRLLCALFVVLAAGCSSDDESERQPADKAEPEGSKAEKGTLEPPGDSARTSKDSVQERVAFFINALKDEDPEVRERAAEALGSFGPESKEAVPALIEALKDDDEKVCGQAAHALAKVGHWAIPTLTKAIGDEDPVVREAVAEVLTWMRWNRNAREQAVPALKEALKDEDPEVRSNAARVIQSISRQLLFAPKRASGDEAPDVPEPATAVLGKIDMEAKEAIPTLIKALKQEESDVREAAAEALGRIGPESEAVTSALVEALKDENPKVRRSAAWALTTKEAVPALIEALKDKDVTVCEQAATSLSYALGYTQLDEESADAILSLQEIADNEDENPEVRDAAREAIKRLK